MGVKPAEINAHSLMKHFDGKDPKLFEKLGSHLTASLRNPEVKNTVSGILERVQAEGDAGLIALTERFDDAIFASDQLRVSAEDLHSSVENLSVEERAAIEEAIKNISTFHDRGHPEDWISPNSHGGTFGERFYPIRRAGIYVPGGQVPLVSTVLMTTTLAKVAGVPEVVVVTPPRSDGTIDTALLGTLGVSGVDEIYKIGGAQAVAALAFGTETVPAVDKIFGPGNVYVNEAKRQVFGIVGVDLLPGPSEVMVLADETAHPSFVAAAILAQAEHGSGKEKVFLLGTDEATIRQSLEEIDKQVETLNHREAIQDVLEQGFLVVSVVSEEQAIEVANLVAPEHLELQVDANKIERFTSAVTTAGAILQGHDTPTVLGDFAAGPSHVLPTGRAARFSSGLRLSDFFRRSSILRYDLEALRKAENAISRFSSMEKLDAHGRSLSIRLKNRE